MVRLQPWQWAVLALPLVAIAGFILTAAGVQIHAWGLNWIWGVIILMLVLWRGLLARWTKPVFKQVEEALEQAQQELDEVTEAEAPIGIPNAKSAAAALEEILTAAQQDPPVWEDWNPFWERCREVVTAVAQAYHPGVKYPLLNIYLPDAYGLLRGTVDDVDRWIETLTPVLGQVTVGQAVQGYEVYRQVEPSARKLWQAWNWAQWLINPAAAAARTLSEPTNNLANQQLLGNLNALLREATLRNLYRQSVALYGGELPTMPGPAKPLPTAQTQTLREILDQAESVEQVAQKPVNILLVGRTGAGKSSVINTLFDADLAEVDVLPSTDEISTYRWQGDSGETLTLWDSPGYEQVNRADYRDQLLDCAREADLLLLVTPALDPALQMDADLLHDMREEVPDLPAITALTQVDRLRPLREWQPPYDWQWGSRPKEISIREATRYRQEQLGELCDRILPLVTRDGDRPGWNTDALSTALIELIDPVKELRLARFLRDRETKITASARLIDRYRLQMSTTQGVTAFLKSPVLKFLATLTTGSPALAYLLAEQIPVEQLPVVLGKLQLAYDLFKVIGPDKAQLDLLALWPLLLDHNDQPDRAAWAFGHAMVEYWSQGLAIADTRQRVEHYLGQYNAR
ncbi:GTPase family protein [Nodosilinea sp. LEGE 07298]|uniref:GTPase family protein n=1 Tax=Nodosilinea sp. LEGE 07298 TaxID=2777970 RepID=UPI001882B31D|nr:GTPase family protein [Nodosilinea sp. LEGE 07298]MBE9110704.1 GTPase family protein [Nodosilinea sp. LEGE 07298]